MAGLKAALVRKEQLLRERSDLLQREDLLAQEFEHRPVNSLQLIVSLLSSPAARERDGHGFGGERSRRVDHAV